MLPTIYEESNAPDLQPSLRPKKHKRRHIHANSRRVYLTIQGSTSGIPSVSNEEQNKYKVSYRIAIREPRPIHKKSPSNDENRPNFVPLTNPQTPRGNVIITTGEKREEIKNKQRKHCSPAVTHCCLYIRLSDGIYLISCLWILHSLWLVYITGQEYKEFDPVFILILVILMEIMTILLAVFGIITTYILKKLRIYAYLGSLLTCFYILIFTADSILVIKNKNLQKGFLAGERALFPKDSETGIILSVFRAMLVVSLSIYFVMVIKANAEKDVEETRSDV
ncbi:6680_t:CDS:2 [Ambispora gerdemannii]|uniref:6680_t:CDS:1 n=1 Tax=Ambispora gerdemannii TaxID=144530 RepID=A0A9N9ADU7_9GLOM|nr:6680_t:CDS:2 [Ambispora gerdemannii]